MTSKENMKNYNQDDHYAVQQINVVAKTETTEMFFSKRSYNNFLGYLRDKVNGQLVSFTPFFSDVTMLQRGIENICIYTNSRKMIICSM